MRSRSALAIDTTDRLAHLVRDAGKLLSRALQSRLAERSIPYGHWTFLRILWKRDGVNQAELSELAGVSAPSTVAAVRSMERSGHIVRKRRRGNRKKVYVHLTPAGRALKRTLQPLAIEVNDIATSGLSPKQVADFRDVLVRMIENLNGTPPPSEQ